MSCENFWFCNPFVNKKKVKKKVLSQNFLIGHQFLSIIAYRRVFQFWQNLFHPRISRLCLFCKNTLKRNKTEHIYSKHFKIFFDFCKASLLCQQNILILFSKNKFQCLKTLLLIYFFFFYLFFMVHKNVCNVFLM